LFRIPLALLDTDGLLHGTDVFHGPVLRPSPDFRVISIHLGVTPDRGMCIIIGRGKKTALGGWNTASVPMRAHGWMDASTAMVSG